MLQIIYINPFHLSQVTSVQYFVIMSTNGTTTSTTIAPDIIYDDGLSGGSVFCLLFFTGLALYFGGGMALRKFMRGADGQEMIPHYEFWADLPYLIKVVELFSMCV